MPTRIDLQSLTHRDIDGELVGVGVVEAGTLEEAHCVLRKDVQVTNIKRIEAYEKDQPLPAFLFASRPPCLVVYFRLLARMRYPYGRLRARLVSLSL